MSKGICGKYSEQGGALKGCLVVVVHADNLFYFIRILHGTPRRVQGVDQVGLWLDCGPVNYFFLAVGHEIHFLYLYVFDDTLLCFILFWASRA